MNYATIKKCDVSNGLGVRVSLYVSGCRNRCKNCFNPETWDFNYGKAFTKDVEQEIIKELQLPYIRGFTLLGGDPFEEENAIVLLPFMQKLREMFPNKSFWCFTGYDFENLLAGKKGDKNINLGILKTIDVLVDGKFVEQLKDLNLKFKGSSNQRTILVKESLEKGEVVLWDEETFV